jgi:hypothetical protein
MAQSKHTGKVRKFMVIALLAMLVGAVPGYAALAQVPSWIDGTVQFEDRTLCYYNNPFFDKWVYPLIEELDANGNVIGPGYDLAANHMGRFEMPLALTTPPSRLRVTCESLVIEHVLTQVDLNTEFVALTLPNNKPRAAAMLARLNGLNVERVPGGTTITAEVFASDADGDLLHYEWGASGGTVNNNNSPQATWTLPNSRGLHFLYVLISDGKGGYEEKSLAISTDGAVLPSQGAFRVFMPLITQLFPQTPPAPPPLKPSDHVPAGNQFLTFSALTNYDLQPVNGVGGPLDNRASACAYYRDLGVVDGCTVDGQPTGNQLTFAEWKLYWGFGSPFSNEVSAKYANLADLNLQRDMHTLSWPVVRPDNTIGTDVASYVCNSPNPPEDVTLSNTRLGNNLVACVSFEFSVTYKPGTNVAYNNGQPFTKFLTFGPTGELLLSVNLDGRGEKFIPGACVACHGGSDYEGRYGVSGNPPDPNLFAKFIPYDLDNYQFSTTLGFGRADQEDELRALNMFVLDTDPYTPTVELINGWYPTPNSNFNGSFVPPGWVGHEDLYNAFVEPHCRMCHVAYRLDWVPFDTYANFSDPSVLYYLASRVCGAPSIERYKYSMPNTKQTFDRFWTSTGGTPGVNNPAMLLAFLQANGEPITKCELPDWMP